MRISSTASGEQSSNTPLSSMLSCSGVAFNNGNDMSSCIPSPEPEDCPDDRSDDYKEASQSRLIPDCSPRTVDEQSPSGPADALHVNMPDLMDLEQAGGRESGNSHSRTPSIQCDKSPSWANPRKCNKRERLTPRTRKQDTTRECYPSVAVVIPPPRPRPVRSLRSGSKPVALDAYESGRSEDVDDSSDEDYMTDTIRTESPHVEEPVKEKHGPPSTTASYYPSETSFASSTPHCGESRDIVGRAILTIETRGSEPTFFFTLVPDNVRSAYVPAHSPPRSSEKAGRVLKRSTSTSRSTYRKSKCRPYSTSENDLLVRLKEEGRLTWKEIADHFPGRELSALQVHYSTKLRHQRAKRSRPQSRRRKKR